MSHLFSTTHPVLLRSLVLFIFSSRVSRCWSFSFFCFLLPSLYLSISVSPQHLPFFCLPLIYVFLDFLFPYFLSSHSVFLLFLISVHYSSFSKVFGFLLVSFALDISTSGFRGFILAVGSCHSVLHEVSSVYHQLFWHSCQFVESNFSATLCCSVLDQYWCCWRGSDFHGCRFKAIR